VTVVVDEDSVGGRHVGVIFFSRIEIKSMGETGSVNGDRRC
jgi:hypothetical protein